MDKFPEEIHLTGPDYFQVVLDAHHRKYGSDGNLSRLAVTCRGELAPERVTERIREIPFISWLYALRLQLPVFGRPRWKQVSITPPVVGWHACTDVLDIPVSIDPTRESPLRIDMLHSRGNTCILFSWNHILMDARGAEMLLAQMGSELQCIFYQPEQVQKISWKERISHIMLMKDYILERVRVLPAVALNSGMKARRFGYRVVHFTEDDTHRIDRHADEHRVRLGKSAFYLAANVSAFQDVLVKEPLDGNYWIPVPQDRRRKGVSGPIMSNQVSSLFYGATGAEMESMPKAVATLSASMMDQIRQRIPESNKIMMDAMVYAPLWLYKHLVTSPTKGRLASFFFSDTGTSLEGMTAFLGHEVFDAVHYPPASAIPGWTCIFMRVLGRQQVIICHPDATKEDAMLADQFEEALRKALLGTH